MSRRGFRVVVASISFVAWTGTAGAQNEPPPEAPPANFGPPPAGHEPPQPWTPGDSQAAPAPVTSDIAPGFMTMDRVDAHTRLGLQVGFNKLDDIDLGDGFFMRFNPYAQYVFPNREVGIYGQLPFSHAFIFSGTGEDATGWGNLELGGFYMPFRNNDLILRAGLAAATASDESNTDGIITNAATVYERLTDFVLIAPNYTTGRLSASTVQQMDQFFFRADGGFDLVIDRPSMSTGPSVFFRANAAAGYRVPDAVDLAFELVNIAAVNGDVDGGITERFIHTAALTLRTPGVNQIHVGTIFPLDEDARGEVWILSFGYQRAM
jgi:hypothetical protein